MSGPGSLTKLCRGVTKQLVLNRRRHAQHRAHCDLTSAIRNRSIVLSYEDSLNVIPLQCGTCRNFSSETSSSSTRAPSTSRGHKDYPSRINKAAQKGNTTLAESLLIEMHEEYNKTKEEKFKPKVSVFSMVLNAWAKSGSTQAPQRAESILERMWELHKVHQFKTKPDVVSYTSVMSCWARSGQKEAAERTEALLREMQEFWKRGEDGLRPNAISYTIAMSAYAKIGQTEKVESLMKEMYIDYSENGNKAAQPTVISYNTLLDAFSKSKSPIATQRVDEIIATMEDLHESGKLNVKPNIVSYNCALYCWANSKDPKSALKTVALLRELQKRSKRGEKDLRPTAISYNTTMNVFARRGQADKAESLLEEMYIDYTANGNDKAKPTVVSFNNVLDAWSKCRSKTNNAPERAESILIRMEELNKTQKLNVKPNMVSYNCVIYCWANSKQTNSAQQAEAVFRKLLQRWREGDRDLQPDAVSYNTVLHAYAKRGLPQQAEALLQEMEESAFVRPTVRSYTAVMDAWSKSRSVEAPIKAEALLSKMRELYDSGYLESPPDTKTYTCVIHCWSRSNDATTTTRKTTAIGANTGGVKRMMDLLEEMVSLAAQGDKTVKPSVVTFNVIARAIHFSKELSRTEKQNFMRRILIHMQENRVAPDDRTKIVFQKFKSEHSGRKE